MTRSSPPPAVLTPTSFQKALELYPSLVENVYKTKLKNDRNKVADALKRDRWRFEELPAAVSQKKANVGQATERDGKANGKPKGGAGVAALGLSKEEVERLVQWKITHGHSQPFLPAMVRKNDASAVQIQTSLALKELALPSTPDMSKPLDRTSVNNALDHVCKLTGIGPATGTLILSVFAPDLIPFFQDEMFAWFFPNAGKLKYSLKEYQQLLEAVIPVLTRLNCKAVELEKVAYVLGHLDLLGDEERGTLEKSFEAKAEPGSTADDEPKEASSCNIPKGEEDVEKDANRSPQEQIAAKPGRKRTAKVKEGQNPAKSAPTPAPRGTKRNSTLEDNTKTEPHTAKRRSQRNR
ncbi:hypothetical protein PV04_06491 [Phialophora macrospora]|uniref:Uncharacterized protein n=1 Tax=Phialophora macrospora TaxID=1851006 RepID=A0A0D2FKE8_9EURO|nr:hypothetical protein PV04_06491 [Phialophora macrospora]